MVFRTLTNINGKAFWKNNERFSVVNYFRKKSSIIDFLQDSYYASQHKLLYNLVAILSTFPTFTLARTTKHNGKKGASWQGPLKKLIWITFNLIGLRLGWFSGLFVFSLFILPNTFARLYMLKLKHLQYHFNSY